MCARWRSRKTIFAANRAVGRIALSVKAAGELTRRARVHEEGPLRVRFPTAHAGEAEAVLVNTAGGMAGGDRYALDLDVGAGARLAITTAAAEKVYRTLGPDTTIDVTLSVDAGGELAWLPQETILFDGARLRRSIDVALADGARLLLARGHGVRPLRHGRERCTMDCCSTAGASAAPAGCCIWRASGSTGAIAEKLAAPAIASGGVAMATVLAVPGDDAPVEAVRRHGHQFRGRSALRPGTASRSRA